MYPVIANLGPFTISSLGLFMSLAFFFGSFKIWRKAREEHMDDEDIFDVVFLCLFGGMLGARILYVILNFGKFGFQMSRWFDLAYNNGFVWMGFLIGVMLMGALVVKKKKIDFWVMMDTAVDGVIWANILVLFGLFLDCSYFGRVSSLPWAITWPGVEGARHPLPFYEITILIFVLWLVKWLDKRYRLFTWYQNKRGNANPGFLWLSYLSVLAISQFILSLVMEGEMVLGPLTAYQIFLIIFILWVGFVFWLRAGNEIKLIDDTDSNSSRKREDSKKRTIKVSEVEKKEKLEVIRPMSKTPVRELKKRERPKIKRFKRAKKGIDYK